MVSSQQVDIIGESHFQLQQQKNHFDWKFPSIDVVPQEKITGCRGVAEHLKHAEKVIELSMDIAYDGDGGNHIEESWLIFYFHA